jgi:hypothetical protein
MRSPINGLLLAVCVGALLLNAPLHAQTDLVVTPPERIDFREVFLDRDGVVTLESVTPPDSLGFREPFLDRDGQPLTTDVPPRSDLQFREPFVGRDGDVLVETVERPPRVVFREPFLSRDGNVLSDQIEPPEGIDYRPPFVGRESIVTSIGSAPAPRRIENARAVPNPFNPSTRISFQLHREGHVSVSVYDARGRLIRVLHDGKLDVDAHVFRWDGSDRNGDPVASGVYVVRIASDTEVVFVKGVMIK